MSVAALAVTAVEVPFTPVTAAEAVPAEVSCPADRPDEAAALVTARMCGGEVKIAGFTNEYDEGWAQPDGSVRWDHHYRPVRVKDGDAWTPVDTTLELGADGIVRPKATAVDLAFSGGGTTPMVSVSDDGSTLELGSPVGALPAPVLDGDTATYPEVLPGVDMQLRADVDGYAQVLVVKNRQAAQNPKLATLQFALTGKNLTVTADSAGNLRGTDGKGKLKFAGNAPEMWDASGQPAAKNRTPQPEGAAGRLKRMKLALAKNTISVAPDQSMLTDADTVYPVYIDPGVTATRSSWTKVNSVNPTTSYWNSAGVAQVGGTTVASNKYRSFFVLDVGSTPIAGKHINTADFHITQQYAMYCESHPVELWATTSVGAATTWNNQPTWSGEQGSVTSLAGCGSSNPATALTFDVTGHVQAAANGSWTTLAYGLRAPAADETGLHSYKEFNNNPYVVISYTAFPTITSVGTIPAAACKTGTARPYINTSTPTLRVRVTDPEGASVRPEIEWDTAAGVKIGSKQPLPGQASGSLFAATVPAGAFVEGGTYSWKARGFDSSVWGPWNTPCEFTIDTVAPATPTVSSDDYPAAAWSGGANEKGDFTFAANASNDVVAYEFGLDVNPPDRTVNASQLGASSAVQVIPSADGMHTLYVRSRDRAGNRSAVNAYTFGVGQAGLTAPQFGSVTAERTAITAQASPGITGATYQWRRAATDAWQTIPVADVARADGGTAVTWPLPVQSGAFPKINWDVAKSVNDAEPGAEPLSGPLQVRATFTGAVTVSDPVVFTLDRDTAGADPLEVGPASVNPITGNAVLSSHDVSIDGNGAALDLSRTFNTRDAGHLDPMFGPGWSSNLDPMGVAATPASGLSVTGSLVQMSLQSGGTVGFTKKAETSTSVSFSAETGNEDLALSYDKAADFYRLDDEDGVTVRFARPAGTPVGQYVPVQVIDPNRDTTIITWQLATVAGAQVTRPSQILAPAPTGVTCDPTTPTARGCKSLQFDYASTTTATGADQAAWGDFTGRLSTVRFTAWDPAAEKTVSIAMARFGYDNSGRLRAAWDPREDHDNGQHVAETYGYAENGVLTELRPAGQLPWQFGYTVLPGDSGNGRLATVSRSALSAGVATQTVVYRVPLDNNGPSDMTAAMTSRWGQSEPPTDATALFPVTQNPTGDQARGELPKSYERATVAYFDADGRTVNTVAPGGGTTAAVHDAWGNEIRALDAQNLWRALNTSASDSPSEEAELAAQLSTVSSYSADGQELIRTLGPEHDVRLADGTIVRGRSSTVTTYDEGAPVQGLLHLPTTATTSVAYFSNGREVTADATTTKTEYNWDLQQATKTTSDVGGLGLVSKISYDTLTSRPATITKPGGGSTDTTPSTRKMTYYRAGTGSEHAECDKRPEWTGLLCVEEPAGQPASGPELPATLLTYNIYGQPLTAVERISTGTLRTTTTSYDTAGRITGTRVSAPDLGSAVPATRLVYQATTGLLAETQSLNSDGTVLGRVQHEYDAAGRQISYTDADGMTTTSTYDVASRVTSTNDGRVSRQYEYDSGDERRGLLSRVTDSSAGAFTAMYDLNGQLAQEYWPNSVVVTHGYDEAGQDTHLDYAAEDCPSGECWLYAAQAELTVDGQQSVVDSSVGVQAADYDGVGRVTRVQRSTWGWCSTNIYELDSASNRTRQQAYGPADNGACQETTADSTSAYTYDTANRVLGGYAYDKLGRTTVLPASDTGAIGDGNMTLTYHQNDLVRSMVQGNRTTTYTLDVDAARVRSWTDTSTGTAVTHRNHYADDSDSPSWTDEGDGTWTRQIDAIGGLAGRQTPNGIEWQITDLHGDVVASMSNGESWISVVHTFDEYGNADEAADVGSLRYGWLGSAQRASDTPGGLILMGVRLYAPATGRMLQTDPELSGSANGYDYCGGDPIGCRDLNGRDPQCSTNCQTDSWLFHNPLSNFIKKALTMVYPLKDGKRLNRTNGAIDWSTDGCSDVVYKGKTRFHSPETYHGAALWKACWRHDFGYRNYKKQHRFTEYNRGKIDNNFKSDMYGLCSGVKGIYGSGCRSLAYAYWAAVRNFGK
ncbi:phospholipase A2 [Actinoplanes sp. CA-054009]